MTPDDATSIDPQLLESLLAADALLADGLDPVVDQPTGTHSELSDQDVAEYVDILRRLGHRTATPVMSELEDTPPLRLGRFEIVGTLGQGGFGIVYLAVDPTLGREVALKVPRPEVLITPDVRRRFLREARAAAGLDHPNIIGVHEVGEAGPVCYIASAYCPGPTLSGWLKARTEPAPPRLAAQLLALLSDAVRHAHDRGVLHRDIKPSNVILSGLRISGSEIGRVQDGAPSRAASLARPAAAPIHGECLNGEGLVPRLTDFGLARIVEESGDETRTGVPLGSPPYMAPEQAAGRNRDVGQATDVYALGATLYEVLTGRPPFRGETPTETLRMVIDTECVSPRILRPGLARDLETICLKCLEKDLARRYPSAASLREDIERFLQGEPIHARPISVRLRAAKWVRRRPMHAGALLLVTLLASGLVGGIVYRNVLLQSHTLRLEHEVARADASARLARRHLSAFQLRQAKQALDANQVERAQDILSAMQVDRSSSDGGKDHEDQGFAWHYLRNAARRDIVVLSDRQAERVCILALSRDGQTLATGDEDGTIRLRDPETGRVRMTLRGHQLPIGLFAFSLDGRRLVSRGTQIVPGPRRDEVLLWDLSSARLLARLEGLSDRYVEDLRFDPRGERLWERSWTERDGGRLGFWDVGTDPAHPKLQWSGPTSLKYQSVMGAGTGVACEEPGRRFVVRDALNERNLGRIGPIDHNYDLAVLSADGRLLAVGRRSRTVSLWDIAAGCEKARYELPRDDLDQIVFSPDSRYLAFLFGSGGFLIRDLLTGASRTIPPSVSDPLPSVAFAFSLDSRLLAKNVSALGNEQPTTIWQLDPWLLVATYPGAMGSVPSFSFTPDGRSLILIARESAIRWNYSPRPEPDQPTGHADEAWSLAFSPDGAMLASGSDDTDKPETIKLWDVATGRIVRGWYAGVGTVAALAFDHRGQVLASAHLEKPGEVRLWDPTTGQRLAALTGHTDYVRAVAFNPDGTILASAGSDRAIRLWDVRARRCIRVLNGHTDIVRQVAFSPDGVLLASASGDHTVRLWNVATGTLTRTLQAIDDVAAVAVAPDGKSLAAADEKGMLSVWDLGSGARVQSMAFEQDFLLTLAYSPDGRSLAVAGKTRTIRLWDPATAQELLSLEGHKAQINSVAFSPDGQVLASCSHDGAVKLWRGRRE
jgi:eukaryotic-like serine/threonine-protein kinase